MEAARFFLKLPQTPPIFLLSEWLPISLTPEPQAHLCTLHLFTDSKLYSTSKPVTFSSCNAQIQGSIQNLLREAFSTRKDKYDFSLTSEDMDARLEVRMSVNPTHSSYLRLITIDLERVYMDDPLTVFFTHVERMSTFMTEEITARDRRIQGFNRLEGLINTAKEDVNRLRQETSVDLAGRLIVIYNSLKQKLREMANDGRFGAGDAPVAKRIKPE